jgi:peptidyl-prolyl cis-trans isomerase D
MLQSLRQHASSWIVKILFGFLILSFSLWGINDIFTGERDPTVAKVGDAAITFTQLDNAVRQQMARLQPLFGGALDRDQAKQLGLIDQALDTLVDRAAFANAVDDFGLVVTDDMIRRHIQSESAFHNSLGQFDRAQFHRVLAQNGLNEGTYVAGLRRDLAAAQIMGAVTANTPAPDTLLASLHRYREESRVADTMTVPASESETPPVPDQAIIEKHYQATIQQFMTPELRTISYVLIDPAALVADVSVSDEQLKAEYEARIAEFTVPEKRDVDQVVLKDEDEAKQVIALLDQGKSLEEAVKEAKSTASVVKLGWVERKDLIGDLADPAFSLQAGQHSAPIKSPLGWHVLTVNKVEKGHVTPFEEARDRLRKDLAAHKAADEAHSIGIKFEDALAGGATLAEAADQIGLKPVTLPPMDAKGMTADGKPVVPDLVKEERFMRAVSETPQGQESQMIELPQDRFAVVRVEKIAPPAAKPLDEVKDQVIASWQAEQRMAAAKKRADAIAERINKGETPAAVAESEKLPLKTTPAFSRTSQTDTGLPDSLKAQMFELQTGRAAVGEADQGYVVGILKEIKPAPEMAPDARTELSSQVSRAIADDLVAQLITALRARYHVEVRRDIIDSRF